MDCEIYEEVINEEYDDFVCEHRPNIISPSGRYYMVIDFLNDTKKICHFITHEQKCICQKCKHSKLCMSLTPLSWLETLEDFRNEKITVSIY